MPDAPIFDVDGTLLDSVDLHAHAWREALLRFGHDVTFEEVRRQIDKGGDQLIPVFLSEAQRKDHGSEMEQWRAERFSSRYLPMVRPLSAVPELLNRVREDCLKIAVASSSNAGDLDTLLDVARIKGLIDATTSAADAQHSKPAPDIFEVALSKLKLSSHQAVAVGDTPYDAEAAAKAGIPTVGMLSGGFSEHDLRAGGCIAIYRGPSALLVEFDGSALAK